MAAVAPSDLRTNGGYRCTAVCNADLLACQGCIQSRASARCTHHVTQCCSTWQCRKLVLGKAASSYLTGITPTRSIAKLAQAPCETSSAACSSAPGAEAWWQLPRPSTPRSRSAAAQCRRHSAGAPPGRAARWEQRGASCSASPSGRFQQVHGACTRCFRQCLLSGANVATHVRAGDPGTLMASSSVLLAVAVGTAALHGALLRLKQRFYVGTWPPPRNRAKH